MIAPVATRVRRAPPAALRVVLFDWDGTLVDSAEVSYRCYVRLFGEYGITFDRECFERTYSPNWHHTYEQLGLPRPVWEQADARWLEHYTRERTSLLPGAQEALDRLRARGLRVALVTSGDRRRVSQELARLGLLEAFEVVTCGDDTEERKPHPAPLLSTLERLGLPAAAAVYVGDSPEDVQMARAAEVYAVGVPGGFPNRDALAAAEPEMLVPDLATAAEALLAAAPSAPPPDRVVPMVDLRAQGERIREDIDRAVREVMESGRFIGGPVCAAFEQEFAAYCGVDHACGVANGTDALQLALRALGVGPGDDVITPAFTFIGTAEAVLLAGARPVFVDVDPDTFTLDPARLEAALTPRTRAIVAVHLYGHPADMPAIQRLADRHGLPVVEDAAQAHGAEVAGRRVGALGQSACFSFYPTKNLGACGDAGMVTSNDRDFVERVRQIAGHGAGAHPYDNVVPGTNSRLDACQAAVLRVKLRHLDAWNAERRERAGAYTEALAAVPGLDLPRERGARSSWYLYTVRTADRDGLLARLRERGIQTAVHYPRPVHLQPAMAGRSLVPGPLPVSEELSARVLSLPLYPELPLADVRYVAAEVRRHFGGG